MPSLRSTGVSSYHARTNNDVISNPRQGRRSSTLASQITSTCSRVLMRRRWLTIIPPKYGTLCLRNSAEVVWAPSHRGRGHGFHFAVTISTSSCQFKNADMECYAVQLYGNFLSFSVPVAVEVRSPQIKFGLSHDSKYGDLDALVCLVD